MGERKEVVLADILQKKGYIRGPFGSALKRPEMKLEGIPVYEQQQAINNTRDFRFFVDEEKFESMKRFQVDTNDLLISCSGTVGKVTIIREDDPKGIISQALLILRADTNKVLPEYLKYFFTSQQGYNAIVSRSSGSVQVNISKREVIEQIPLSLPSLEEQGKIVDVLKTIDDKIELNNKVTDNLQQQGQALFAEMFLTNSDSDSTDGVLSDIATITMGQSPSGSSYNEDAIGEVFYQGRAEFGFRFPTRRLFTTESKRMAEAGDVLLSVRAPVGDLNVAYERCCIGRGLGAIHSKNGNSSFILYMMLALKPQLDVFNGQGTVFGSINRDALNAMAIEIPSAERVAKFEAIAHPMDDLIRTNYEEICRLEKMRDSLLPKLMSGEIDVSNIQL